MIRKPIVNVPKEKKAPKPIQRRALKWARQTIRRVGKRGREKMKAKHQAVVAYFKEHGTGSFTNNCRIAPCQMCGRPMVLGGHVVDACHKVRASQGGGEHPENLVIAHRRCHLWQHLARPQEEALVASLSHSGNGLIVEWPESLKNALETFLATNSEHVG